MLREENAIFVVQKLEPHEIEICLGPTPVSVSCENGVIFTPWMALPGVNTPDVLRSLLPETPSCHDEATNRN
ncbi:hypothetical protein TNCV_2692101 [Trichonephila clavipes]|uniref:Uncharacterized protein n=1 Tax=Trichonephila clavipes TaxID=2585209 RepID=A0A8X6VYZ9_TRICX|nr:hypothetical protein TNCV_2692101 [Trichonephila clavipes]